MNGILAIGIGVVAGIMIGPRIATELKLETDATKTAAKVGTGFVAYIAARALL